MSGGVDHLVRLWNPYVPSKPIALLSGHSTAVVDVLIHREAALVFSLSQDLVTAVDGIAVGHCHADPSTGSVCVGHPWT